jgi:hypothetical protein
VCVERQFPLKITETLLQFPGTKEILRKAKIIFADDPDMVRYCGDVLSGASMKGAEAYYLEVHFSAACTRAGLEKPATT